jgi:drug/metabolite transporter (DMT)-like permease
LLTAEVNISYCTPKEGPYALPYIWMLAGSGAFALMAALAHALASRCDWQLVALARSLIALLIATLLLFWGGGRLIILRPPILWLRSLAGSLSLVCTFYALMHLPISIVLTVTNIYPIWVAVLSGPLLGDWPPLSVWLAATLAVAGVALMQQPELTGDGTTVLIAVIASVATAFAMLGLHRLKEVDPRAVVVHFSAVGSLACVVSLFAFPRTAPVEHHLDWWTVALLLGVGISATVGQLFLTRAFAAGQPTQVAVVGLSQVVIALLIDWLVWQRTLTLWAVVGMVLVLGPTAWVMLSRRPSQPEGMAQTLDEPG